MNEFEKSTYNKRIKNFKTDGNSEKRIDNGYAGIIITNNNRAQSGGRYLSDNGLTEKSAAVHSQVVTRTPNNKNVNEKRARRAADAVLRPAADILFFYAVHDHRCGLPHCDWPARHRVGVARARPSCTAAAAPDGPSHTIAVRAPRTTAPHQS